MTLGPVFSNEDGQFYKVPEVNEDGLLKKVREWTEVAGPFPDKAAADAAYKRAVRELLDGEAK